MHGGTPAARHLLLLTETLRAERASPQDLRVCLRHAKGVREASLKEIHSPLGWEARLLSLLHHTALDSPLPHPPHPLFSSLG